MLLLIDNYDSFTYNLVHYLGALGTEIIVRRNDALNVQEAMALRPSGILLSPGPCDPDQAGICLALTEAAAKTRTPLMGVCLGHQTIGQAFGGRVVRADDIVHGKMGTIHHDQTGVFAGLPTPFAATRYHSLIVERATLPDCLTVTAQLQGGTSFVYVNDFTAADLQFQAFVFDLSPGSFSGGLQIAGSDRGQSAGPAGYMRFWSFDSASQVISWNAAGYGKSNNGYGGRSVFTSASISSSMMGTGVSATGNYMGFAVQNEDTGTYVAGWVQMAFDFSAGNVANGSYVTIMDWSFNTGDVNTSITMPGSPPQGGSGAVPGVGGLAGLAMGAAGLRRKRQRVA